MVDSPGCPKCGDVGWVYRDGLPVNDPGFGKLVRCFCREERDRLDRERVWLNLCKLPEATDDKTFPTFRVTHDNKESFRLARLLAEEEADNGQVIRWLTLISPPDRGKTHLAVAICRRWLERGRPARYIYVPLLLEELRKGFDSESEWNYHRVLNFFLKVPLLVLDDFGVEKLTDWGREQLDTIIDYRYINKLHLVITTNQTPAQMPPRIASRLQRAEFGRCVTLGGKEYRLRNRGDFIA